MACCPCLLRLGCLLQHHVPHWRATEGDQIIQIILILLLVVVWGTISAAGDHEWCELLVPLHGGPVKFMYRSYRQPMHNYFLYTFYQEKMIQAKNQLDSYFL